MAIPSVVVDSTEQHILESRCVGQNYIIKVWLPDSYHQTDLAFPVLYLLDGDHAFAMATDIVEYLTYGSHVPKLIIVSPAYGDKRMPEFNNGVGTNMRGRDFRAFEVEWSPFQPGADKYLEFVRQELIPFVESRYRTTPDRTLWGYSGGSWFALYTLLSQPGLFGRYICVDGIHAGHLKLEQDYAASHGDLPVRLAILPGGHNPEELTDHQRLHQSLLARNYPGLKLDFIVLNDLGHFAVSAEGLTKGLIAVFRDA